MAQRRKHVQKKRIGTCEFDVVVTPEFDPEARSEERTSAWAAWLLAEWQREQQEKHVLRHPEGKS